MSDNELHNHMTTLYNVFKSGKIQIQDVIGKAVNLGMDYQEQKIKSGIDIVFEELHKKGIGN